MIVNAPNPSADLLRIIDAFQASRAVHVAAELGIADLLRSGPREIDDLAVATHTHSRSLYRLLRTLSAVGVFREDDGRRFALTDVGEYLLSDIPGSLRGWARLLGRRYYWQAWGALLHSVQTGAVAFDHVHGRGVWEYRAEQPVDAQIFDRAMATGTQVIAEAVLAVRDFSPFGCVVDVGGGDGTLLGKILTAHPSSRGVLFDQPHVVKRATPLLQSAGLAHRCQAIGGNFFESVPAGGDAYLLKWILHDWDDDASIAVLRSCRRAMPPDGRLLVVEHVIGPPNESPSGRLMDLNMLVITGGHERTPEPGHSMSRSAKSFKLRFGNAASVYRIGNPPTSLAAVHESGFGSAPRRREPSVREGLTRIIVDRSGSWRAAWSGNRRVGASRQRSPWAAERSGGP
jgi:O-methyltransferase domain/Dimerisation domain